MAKWHFIRGLLLFFGVAACVQAAQSQAIPPARRLSQQFASMQSMRGNFSQRIVDEKGQLLQEASGKIVVKRPRQFYWRTQKPYKQLVVASGDTLWLYDMDLEQVTRKPFTDNLDRAPALILSGAWESLAKQYSIGCEERHRQGRDYIVYSLTPHKQDNVFRKLQLTFAGGKIRSMTMVDSFQQVTTIRFTHVEYNVDIDPKLFQFTPPKGIDVISDES